MTQNKPKHFPWLTPYFVVENAEASIQFYVQAFGFAAKEVIKNPLGEIIHVEMTYQQQIIIMFSTLASHEEGVSAKTPKQLQITLPTWSYLYVDDVDAQFKQAVIAGATVVAEPIDMPWGDRCARLQDIDGYSWSLATHVHRCPYAI